MKYNAAQTVLGDYTTHGITAPVHVLFHPFTGSPEFPYLMVGGYYTHLFSGSVDGSKATWEANYNDSEYGVSWGIGLQTRYVQIGMYQRIGIV